MISLICEISRSKQVSKQNKLVDTENTLIIGRGEEDGGMSEKVRGITRYQCPVINVMGMHCPAQGI